MAKTYRTIKFTYNTSTFEIDVNADRNENISREEFSSTIRAIDGTSYKQYVTANEKRIFTYSFVTCNKDVFDFFFNARTAHKAGNTITMDREQDDGTFESFEVLLNPLQWNDDNVTNTAGQKVYRGVTIGVVEV